MQTFLAYPDFKESARILDVRRLGKQRVECLQILRTLAGVSKGWVNHPAVRMWRGYEKCLSKYGIAICSEWIGGRGYRDTCLPQIMLIGDKASDTGFPPWMGDSEFHASHRSNLLRKNPLWYGKYNWREPNNLPYKWPV